RQETRGEVVLRVTGSLSETVGQRAQGVEVVVDEVLEGELDASTVLGDLDGVVVLVERAGGVLGGLRDRREDPLTPEEVDPLLGTEVTHRGAASELLPHGRQRRVASEELALEEGSQKHREVGRGHLLLQDQERTLVTPHGRLEQARGTDEALTLFRRELPTLGAALGHVARGGLTGEDFGGHAGFSVQSRARRT